MPGTGSLHLLPVAQQACQSTAQPLCPSAAPSRSSSACSPPSQLPGPSWIWVLWLSTASEFIDACVCVAYICTYIYFVYVLIFILHTCGYTCVCVCGDIYPGKGSGNPLQYSYLENSMDRGAWWTTTHGVTKSQKLHRYWTWIYIERILYTCKMYSTSLIVLRERSCPDYLFHKLLTVIMTGGIYNIF